MYEQNEVPIFRRIMWIVLWFIVIVAVLWVAIWLIFFHRPSHTAKPTPATTKQTQTQKHNDNSASQNSNNTPSSKSSSQNSQTKTDSTNTLRPAPQPTQLVNTGAGNIMIPFAVSSIAGTAIYYVRLRRKARVQ